MITSVYACLIPGTSLYVSIGRVVLTGVTGMTAIEPETVREVDPSGEHGRPGFGTDEGWYYLEDFVSDPKVDTDNDGVKFIDLPNGGWCFPPRI